MRGDKHVKTSDLLLSFPIFCSLFENNSWARISIDRNDASMNRNNDNIEASETETDIRRTMTTTEHLWKRKRGKKREDFNQPKLCFLRVAFAEYHYIDAKASTK